MLEPRFGYVTPENLALFTDGYELTMLQGCWEAGHDPDAVSAGLKEAAERLQNTLAQDV